MKIPTMVTMSLIGALGEISGVTAGKRNSNSGSTRKVQSPEKRLKKLNAKSKAWLVQYLKTPNEDDSKGIQKYRVNKYNAVMGNIENKTKKMLEVYSLTNEDGEKRCGFFDSLVTNGGPQKFEPQLNNNKIQSRKAYLEVRKKEDNRQARHLLADQLGIDSQALDRPSVHERRLLARIHDFSHIHEKLMELEKWFRNNVDFQSYLDMTLEENEDENDEVDRHRRASGDRKKRTQQTPHTQWRKISTGYRKWAERYIAYCHAEYVEKKFSKWATDKLRIKVGNIYKKLNGENVDEQ